MVVDREINEKVWNAPVRSFRVTNTVEGQLAEITESMAARALGLDVAIQVVLGPTSLAQDERRSGSFTALVDGELPSGRQESATSTCTSRSVGPASENDADRAVVAPTHSSVVGCTRPSECDPLDGRRLRGRSSVQVWIGVPTGVAATTPLNPDAARFFLVELDLDWVTEAEPSSTSRAVDEYTRTDHLQYVLEADSAGAIIGGERLGDEPAPPPGLPLVAAMVAAEHLLRGTRLQPVRSLLLESIA